MEPASAGCYRIRVAARGAELFQGVGNLTLYFSYFYLYVCVSIVCVCVFFFTDKRFIVYVPTCCNVK